METTRRPKPRPIWCLVDGDGTPMTYKAADTRSEAINRLTPDRRLWRRLRKHGWRCLRFVAET